MVQNSLITFKSRLVQYIFFGNIFYGLCAVALSVEAMLQQHFPVNGFWYFFLVFISTVLYYTYPYVRKCSFISTNLRTNWYTRNYDLVRWTQRFITIVLILALIGFLSRYRLALFHMPVNQWILVLIFPATAALYYGRSFFNLRRIGWLKPFMIGFIWAGLVTIYPVIFYTLVHHSVYELNWVTALLFLKNMMFVAVLCIMFDIKDYATDYWNKLRTFVVEVGLKRTIFFILIPLAASGLLSFILYAVIHTFDEMKVILNVIPFLLLIVVALSLCRRRSIFYYLAIVDGLLMVKAVFGIIAITFFS